MQVSEVPPNLTHWMLMLQAQGLYLLSQPLQVVLRRGRTGGLGGKQEIPIRNLVYGFPLEDTEGGLIL